MPAVTGLLDGVEDDDEEKTALDSVSEESEDTTEVVELRADNDDWTPEINIAPSISKVEDMGSLTADFK